MSLSRPHRGADPTTPYNRMVAELRRITAKHKIDFEKGDVLEEFFLEFAGVDEKPTFCQTHQSTHDPDRCVIFCDLSWAALERVPLVNQKYPKLNAKNSTEINIRYGSIDVVRAEAGLAPELHIGTINVSCNGIIEHVLPRLEIFLDENPDVVKHYAACVSCGDAVQTLKSIYKSEGPDLNNSVTATLCQVVQESFKKPKLINDILFNFNRSLIDIIISYTYRGDYRQTTLPTDQEINELTSSNGLLKWLSSKPNYVDLYLMAPVASMQLIVRYFNQFNPRAAFLDDLSYEFGVGLRRIHVTNQALMNVECLADLKTITHQDRIERERKAQLEREEAPRQEVHNVASSHYTLFASVVTQTALHEQKSQSVASAQRGKNVR